MNSVQNVIGFKAVTNQMKLKEGEPAPQVPVSNPQGDTFTPSFKGSKLGVLKNFKEDARWFGSNYLPNKNFFKSFKNLVTSIGLGATMSTTAITATLGTLFLTSCEADPIEVNVQEGDVAVDVQVYIDASTITALLQALHDQDKELWAQLMAEIATMNSLLANNNQLLGQVIEILIQHGAKLDEIAGILGAGFATLAGDNQEIKEILLNLQAAVNINNELAQENNELAAANNDLLTQILAIAISIKDSNNAANAMIIQLMNFLINQIGNLTAQQAQQFEELMELLRQMDEHRANEAAAIMNAIQDLDVNIQAGIAGLMAKMDELNDADQARFLQWMARFDQFDADIQAGIAALGDIINDLTASQRQGIMMLLAKMDSMTAQLKAKINQVIAMQARAYNADREDNAIIIAKLGNLEAANQEIVADLAIIIANQNEQSGDLAAIRANQAIQIQQLETIISMLETQGMNVSEIRAYLQSLDLGTPDVDLSGIEALLLALLNQTGANGAVLQQLHTDFQNFQIVVNAAKDAIVAEINEKGAQNHHDLLNILNAIPQYVANNCNCNECCERVLVVLQQIAEELLQDDDNNTDNNHEGHETDYDDILG